MMNSIFVSTNAFGTKKLNEILEECRDHSILNIELSSINGNRRDIEYSLSKSSEYGMFHFLVHNYSPPPEVPFVLNLASKNTNVLERSLNHCRRAIDLNYKFQASFYGVHCGFCFDAEPNDLGNNLTHLFRYSLEEAEDIFIESLKILSDYAREKGIKLAIENNVLSDVNLIDGQNKLLLGVRAEEIIRYITKTGRDNIGVLLDVGHLKVSAESLGFDSHEFIHSIASLIIGVHLSDNDGRTDTNSPINRESWFWSPLKSILNEKMCLVLEVRELTPGSIKDQVSIIESSLFDGK